MVVVYICKYCCALKSGDVVASALAEHVFGLGHHLSKALIIGSSFWWYLFLLQHVGLYF